MAVLGMLAMSAADSSGIRLMLLVLMLVAVVLLLTGSIITLLTLRNQRRIANARIALEHSESEKR